jgi:hypothetical protein
MANKRDSELTPQLVQQNAQSAVSQDAPLRELHQEGASAGHEPAVQGPSTPELTDEEISVLCDIERDGSARPSKGEVVESLTSRQLIEAVFEGDFERRKLTPHAQRLLTERGVGLNES